MIQLKTCTGQVDGPESKSKLVTTKGTPTGPIDQSQQQLLEVGQEVLRLVLDDQTTLPNLNGCVLDALLAVQ